MKGKLQSMPITEVFQWAEMNEKTGVLVVSKEREEKCFCFQDGKIIFVSSKKEGERLGEFLSGEGNVEEERMKDALLASQKSGIPFTRYLIENGIVPKEFLIVAIQQLAEKIFETC